MSFRLHRRGRFSLRHTEFHRLYLAASLLPIAAAVSGCISCTVGQGAKSAAVGKRMSSSVNVVSGMLGDSAPTSRPLMDTELRYGIDERTDEGFRIST